MGRLILVRHGQASAFTDDYDRLSELGRRQAELLGEWWKSRVSRVTAVYSGPLNRQKGTAEIVTEHLRQSGVQIPETVILDGLREIEADRIMAHFDNVRKEHPDLEQLISTYDGSNDLEERGSVFQEYFERVMLLWAKGKIDSPEIESLSAFQKRVIASLEVILDSYREQGDVVVFSSAGPVTIMAGHLLGLDNFQTLELTFRLKNSSVTEFALISRGPVLQQFNCTGHLPPDMLTIR